MPRMTITPHWNPEDPGPQYGGYQAIADILSEEPPGRKVSRQGVYAWYRKRAHFGFPEKEPVFSDGVLIGYSFDIAKVKTWYAELWVKRSEYEMRCVRSSAPERKKR